MNPGIPLKETTGDGLDRSFPHSLLSTSKRKGKLLEFVCAVRLNRGTSP